MLHASAALFVFRNVFHGRHKFGDRDTKGLTQNKDRVKTGVPFAPFKISEGVQMHTCLHRQFHLTPSSLKHQGLPGQIARQRATPLRGLSRTATDGDAADGDEADAQCNLCMAG